MQVTSDDEPAGWQSSPHPYASPDPAPGPRPYACASDPAPAGVRLNDPSAAATGLQQQRPGWLHTPEMRRLGHDTAYLFAAWPLALVAFILVITLFSTGVSTLIIWVGLPILVLSALTARGFATAERKMLRLWQDRPAPGVYVARDGSWWRRWLGVLKDPQSWLDQLWTVTQFTVSTATWSIAVTWWVGTLGVVLGPLAAVILNATLGGDYNGLGDLLNLPGSKLFWDVLVNFLGGLFFAVTLRPVLRGSAWVQSSLSHALLSSRAETTARINELRDTRDAAHRAETSALRRLERDIHDGPQQRLVRLNMDLARARRLAATDPERAQMILAEAMEQSQDTLAELRQLSRGIAPPILVDRGLAAAIGEAAARSSTPVVVQADLPREIPDQAATAAYFTVAEALTNLNKHARAGQAEVYAGVQDGWLFVTISDDGIGGAALDKGHGLAGLAERLRGVAGRLDVESPVGGPTVVQAAIPLAG